MLLLFNVIFVNVCLNIDVDVFFVNRVFFKYKFQTRLFELYFFLQIRNLNINRHEL